MVFACTQAWASHIIGGDMYYDYIGNNQYRFFITLYRDCNSSGAAYDNPLYLSVFKQGNIHLETVEVPFPGSVILPINFNNPCATPPSGICVERAIYQYVLTLPPIPGGYTVSYQRCCRGPNVTNLIAPDNTGLTLVTHIPGSDTGFQVNSSPRFSNYPPVLLCNNDQLVFNHVATDPDGDQLVYSLVTPYSGANSSAPQPTQMPPPPYFPVNWQANYNAQVPLGPGSSTIINSSTGILTVDPNMLGLFVVGVRVQEYRNGVLIGETIRDFLFRVFDCNIQLSAILPLQTQLPTFVSYCNGLTVQFVNNSYGGSSYYWNFGVPSVTSDVSTAFAPTYTYPSSGTYTAQLIVNPGNACTDTAYMDIIVNDSLEVSWTSQDSLCLQANSFDFVGQVSNPQANLSWTFPQTANLTSATGNLVSNVQFNQAGFQLVSITADIGYCQESFLDSVYLFGDPLASIQVPPLIECLGYTITFGNASQNSNQYQWDFGNGQGSSNALPTTTFPGPGLYTISLIAGSSPICLDSTSVQVQIEQPILLAMTHSDSLCIDSLFLFEAQVSGPSTTQYHWEFGTQAQPSTSTALTANWIHYLQAGPQPVLLIGETQLCKDTLATSVAVFGHPSINFMTLTPDICAPGFAQFVNSSQTDVPTLYTWDFGDGSTSTATNPNHIYPNVGNYTVSLTLQTLFGCVETLYMAQQDLITVHPSPTAGFTVDRTHVDVCDNQVVFTSTAQGASTYTYLVDQQEVAYHAATITHAYHHSGTDHPMQIVTNDYGCSDTVLGTIQVDPFTLYAPNTFTPNQDKHNEVFNVVTDFEVSDWSLEIFNRWGQCVFQTTNPSQAWDGTYNGMACQDGNYNYVVKYRQCDQPYIRKQREGMVTLLK
ncbi:MAG: hypothetical protein RLZZ301_769 [Bacteroidota bacterium]